MTFIYVNYIGGATMGSMDGYVFTTYTRVLTHSNFNITMNIIIGEMSSFLRSHTENIDCGHAIFYRTFLPPPRSSKYSENLICYSQYYTGFTTGETDDVLCSRFGRLTARFLGASRPDLVTSRHVSSSFVKSRRSRRHFLGSPIPQTLIITTSFPIL